MNRIAKILALAGTAGALVLSATASQAVIIYDWSFQDIDQGGANTVSGTFALADSCAGSCSGVSASSVVLGSAPFGPIGFDFTTASIQFNNSFTTVAGIVTSASFDAFDSAGNDFQLAINTGAGPQYFGTFGSPASDGLIFGGGDGLSLTIQRTGTVPAPPTLALLSLGLAGLGFSRRKAKTKQRA